MKSKTTLSALSVVMVALTFLPVSGAWAGTEKVLYSFTGGNDGGYPIYAVVVFDQAGNLYGTTRLGGTSGAGVVYELTPSKGIWQETTLYSFSGGSDGGDPEGGVILDHAGNVYGTTYSGGANGFGTVFELSPTGSGWKETVLYSFAGGNDGSNPEATPILDSAGNLYGTTYNGGTSGLGTVFELSPVGSGWTETVLHSFAGFTNGDGSNPIAGVVPDTAGNLYGTTRYGGGSDAGAVFRLKYSKNHWTETLLYGFTGNDGSNPYGGLVLDKAGNLYGTTYNGGASGTGTVFRLQRSKGWAETVIHSFSGGFDGQSPYSGPAIDKAGNIYGTTSLGGGYSQGVAFELKPSKTGWTESLLWGFSGTGDGGYPIATVTVHKGVLYGTTPHSNGGSCNSGCGVVFELTP